MDVDDTTTPESDEDFSPEVIDAIRRSVESSDTLPFFHPAHAYDKLKKLWNPLYRPPSYKLAEARFLLGMTKEFLKSIEAIDRTLQGRILDAITHILDQPTTQRGDTVKPLSGDLSGMWRYRIGNCRLIYHPKADRGEVLLVRFDGRGHVY
jgi:mRNA interferase RelE/StbE